MKSGVAIVLVFLLVAASTPATASTSLLPVFTGYLIENTDPLVSNPVTVTVFIDIHDTENNDQSGYWSVLTLYLYWSRDKLSWFSVTASVTDTETYTATIPAQDGSDNRYFDKGAGPCYWFIRMINSLEEEDTLFTATTPNSEITFHDLSGSSTTLPVTVTVQEFTTGNFVENILFSVTSDPLAQFLVVVIAGIMIYLLATEGRGFNFLRGFFKR